MSAPRPAPVPQVTVTEITPEMAAEFISTNHKNRKIRPSVVEAYARAMSAGEWMLTGEAIKFDTNGNMIDGQHRMMAVIRANVPVYMIVIRGVDPDTQGVMDSGVKRQTQDYFSMNGIHNSAVISAIARFQLKLNSYAKSMTNSEIISWVESNPGVHQAAELATAYRSTIDILPSVMGVAWMRLSQIDQDQAAEFFESISNNRTEGLGDPRNALIRRLSGARRSSERLSQEVQLSMVYRAWNAWITGEKLSKLQSDTRGGPVKIPSPVPPGTRPRSGHKLRKDLRAQVTPEDYAKFEWPSDDNQTVPA